MRTLHETLKLQHHRHTGKVLHHRHTSYRALAVIFLTAGICMLGLSAVNRVAADTFGVSAVVDVPLPSNPPVITSPSVNTQLSRSSLLVIGSCPLITPQVLVSISVDGTPAGTGACDSNNDFSVPITLSEGTHQLIASVLTISGQNGPSSNPVAITSTTASSSSAVAITAAQPFIYAASKDITWTGTITDSSAQTTEYIHVDWGDGSQSNYTAKAGAQRFSHHYATLVPHNILIAASNSTGDTDTEQFAVATYATYTPTAFVGSTTTSSPSVNTIVGLYGLYLTVLAVTGIIWLEAKHAARQHATA